VGDLSDITVEKRAAAGVFLQEDQNLVYERDIIPALRFKKTALLVLRQVRSFVKQGLNSLPANAVHRDSPAKTIVSR